MALSDNLISYWSLDEASGNALDAHGANDLTDVNTVGSTTGIISNARQFVQANGEKFTHASNSDLVIPDNSTSYTFTQWIQIAVGSGNKQIISKRTGTGIGTQLEYMLRVDNATPRAYWGTTGGSFGSIATSTLSLNTWYFLVWGYDGSTNKFFISLNDGTVAESAVVTTQTVNGSNGFGMGGNGSDNSELHGGLIDEVGFWKRRLSSGEITDLYNGGSGRDYAYIAGGAPAAGERVYAYVII